MRPRRRRLCRDLGFTISVRATTGEKGRKNTLDIERGPGPGARSGWSARCPAGAPADISRSPFRGRAAYAHDASAARRALHGAR